MHWTITSVGAWLLSVLFIMLYAFTSLGQQVEPQQSDIDAAVKEDSPLLLMELYARLFLAAPEAQVRKLQFHENSSLSVRAAWDKVRRTIKLPQDQRDGRPDQLALNRFLGFLEGRLRIDLPDWWRKLLLDARARDSDNVYFTFPSKVQFQRTPFGFFIPHDTSVEKHESDVLVEVDAKKCKIPVSTLDALRRKLALECVTAGIGPKACFLACHSRYCSPYDLVSVDQTSGRQLWMASVYASGGILYSGPGYHHQLSISCDEDQGRSLKVVANYSRPLVFVEPPRL